MGPFKSFFSTGIQGLARYLNWPRSWVPYERTLNTPNIYWQSHPWRNHEGNKKTPSNRMYCFCFCGGSQKVSVYIKYMSQSIRDSPLHANRVLWFVYQLREVPLSTGKPIDLLWQIFLISRYHVPWTQDYRAEINLPSCFNQPFFFFFLSTNLPRIRPFQTSLVKCITFISFHVGTTIILSIQSRTTALARTNDVGQNDFEGLKRRRNGVLLRIKRCVNGGHHDTELAIAPGKKCYWFWRADRI